MSPLSLPPLPPPPDLVRHSTWTSMHATAVHVLPGMLRYLGVAEDDIDDLSQEVLLGAYTSLPRYDPAYPAGSCGAPLPLPSASPSPWDFAVFAAVPAAAPADDDVPAAASEQPDPASPPRPAPRTPSGPSRPHGLGPRWRAESTWLFGIAWRKVRHHLERAYRRHEVPVGLADAACFEGAEGAPSSEQRIARKERLALATRLLAKIAPERRAILILADAYEIPVHEIARALGLNENTAASRLRLAREDYRAAVKRLRPDEQHALRSGLLMLPLFSFASSSSAVASRPAHAGTAVTAVETNAPATLPSPRSDLGGQHDLAGRPGRLTRLARAARLAHLAHLAHLARLARLAHLSRLARPLARFLRPALEWGTAAVTGAAVVAALSPAPVSWANRLGPVATPLVLSHAIDAGARSDTEPGAAPRSEASARDATSAGTTPAARAPTPAPADRSGQRKPAAPKHQARSDQDQDSLAEELLLLDTARQALSQGDRATAMDRITAHERQFPQGRLKLMREQLRWKADATQSAPAGGAARQELP